MEKQILKTLEGVQGWFLYKSLHSLPPDIYSFDWETNSLSYLEMEPVGVSFCDGQRACYIDLYENAEANEILDFIGPLFERGTFIAHHAKFDIKCTRKFCGTEPTNIFCTYIASFLLDENRPNHGLKILVVQDLKIPEKEVQSWEKASQYNYHSEAWYKYSMNDSIWAFELYGLYSQRIHEEGLDTVFYDIEMPFLYVCADMEINGIKVDVEVLNELKARTRNRIIELEDRMFDSVGLHVLLQTRMFGEADERVFPINLRSGNQLRKLLKKHCGISVNNTQSETLAKLKGKHPFIDYLLDYKTLRKLYDAYIVPAYDLIDSDGRIRPSFGIVKTGRTNCRLPNLQQLPNVSKRFPEINYRSIFVAANGCSLVGGDYSGQELRVLGEVSGDERILDSFRNGFDLHLVTANYIFNLGLDTVALQDRTKEHKQAMVNHRQARYQAKNGVNFPIVYGSSEYGIAHNMGVSVETAKEWQKKFFELYPRVKEAMNETKKEMDSINYVFTFMGRRRRFPNYKSLPNYARGRKPSKSRCVRQGFNFKIQGFSADQVKLAAICARKAGLKILLIIHDEIVVESQNGSPQHGCEDSVVLKDCMEHAVCLSVPFIADVKVGRRYSELK